MLTNFRDRRFLSNRKRRTFSYLLLRSWCYFKNLRLLRNDRDITLHCFTLTQRSWGPEDCRTIFSQFAVHRSCCSRPDFNSSLPPRNLNDYLGIPTPFTQTLKMVASCFSKTLSVRPAFTGYQSPKRDQYQNKCLRIPVEIVLCGGKLSADGWRVVHCQFRTLSWFSLGEIFRSWNGNCFGTHICVSIRLRNHPWMCLQNL